MEGMSLSDQVLSTLCDEFEKNNHIDPKKFVQYDIKRGLRNADGSGVKAGLTLISNVHGYVLSEGEKAPIEGSLIYRGINIKDLVDGCVRDDRFGYEETAWLLLLGALPTAPQLASFSQTLSSLRELPKYFAENTILRSPSPNIMNKMARTVLALYAYDENPDDTSMKNVLRQSIELIAMLPSIMAYAYHVKCQSYAQREQLFHPKTRALSTAEMILHTIRPDGVYTKQEARLLDVCLMLHAEHGGGNNSTFAARVLSSSGTDTYSAISGAIGALKGPRHGGANIKVMEMVQQIENGVKNWESDGEVADFLTRILQKKEGDGSGLIYGMGHAVYTLSDPRAVILKQYAYDLAEQKGFGDEFRLLERIERLTQEVFARQTGNEKIMCANVDLYSGLVYKTLGIPVDLFTPLFAVARVAGWCAHRLEELLTGGRIIRPAYKALVKEKPYVALSDR